jgi:hypothetical protein
MIDPKRLTPWDVDRFVIYTDGQGNRTDGVIKSWSADVVVVRYPNALNGQATFPYDLEFQYGTYKDPSHD